MADKFELDSADLPEWLKIPEQIAKEIAIPGTPANKAFNEMMQEVEEHVIAYEEFVVYVIQHAAQIEKLTRQEIQDQQTIEARKHERIIAGAGHEIHERHESVEGKDVYQLEAKAAELQKEIFEIDNKIQQVQKQIDTYSGELKVLHHEWVDHREKQADAFVEELKAKLQEKFGDGTALELRNEMNEKIDFAKIEDKIKDAVTSIKSPPEILKVNPSLKDPKKMMVCNDLVCELRTRASMIEGEVNSKNLLCVIRNNKKMPVYRHSDEETKIAEKAIEAMQKKKKAGDEQEMLRMVKLAKEKEFTCTVDELRSHNKRPQTLPKQSSSDS